VLNYASPYEEAGFSEWEQQLGAPRTASVVIRRAESTERDGRWMRWIQAECESTNIQSVHDNVSKIERQLVLLAEIADIPVGFCSALAGRTDLDPLFIQLVAVVPLARRRGAGLAMLKAAAEHEPQRNVAMAALDDNHPAHGLNQRFAESLGATLRRVPVRQYRPTQLGFAAGERHRPWIVERPGGSTGD
jgi:GNAT superfamily N-acetyltransferase